MDAVIRDSSKCKDELVEVQLWFIIVRLNQGQLKILILFVFNHKSTGVKILMFLRCHRRDGCLNELLKSFDVEEVRQELVLANEFEESFTFHAVVLFFDLSPRDHFSSLVVVLMDIL
jgi:hypothetical protein